MARTSKTKRLSTKGKKSPSNESSNIKAPIKLKAIFVIVPRNKLELYIDILHQFDINLSLEIYAKGTASKEMISMLGLEDTNKAIILGLINDKDSKKVLSTLDEKFKTIKGGKGIAFQVPISSIIGVFIYSFLTNQKGNSIL